MTRPPGIYCRVCGKPAKCAYLRYRPVAGVRIRYFKCACGAKFKSTERQDPPREAGQATIIPE